MTSILSHLPRHWHEVTSLQKIALWQMPLIAVLSLEIGLFMWLFWDICVESAMLNDPSLALWHWGICQNGL